MQPGMPAQAYHGNVQPGFGEADSSLAEPPQEEESIPSKKASKKKPKKAPAVPKDKPDKPNKPKAKTGQKPEKKKTKDKNNENQKEFDPEKAKKMFLLPQALVMLAVAGGISFGLFVDEFGQIMVNNVLALVILVALAEIILYREIYVNRKGAKPGREKKQTGEKGGDSGQPQPASPYGSHPAEPYGQPQPIPPYGQPYMGQLVPGGWEAAPPSGQDYFQEADSDTEVTQLWDGASEEAMAAYLEYYENGRLVKIPLGSPEGVIIGRLASQVDFAVKNATVGKVHARFVFRNNHHYVIDINSKNGTYINGSKTRIESNTPYLLHDKDRIMLAECEFVIRCGED